MVQIDKLVDKLISKYLTRQVGMKGADKKNFEGYFRGGKVTNVYQGHKSKQTRGRTLYTNRQKSRVRERFNTA